DFANGHWHSAVADAACRCRAVNHSVACHIHGAFAKEGNDRAEYYFDHDVNFRYGWALGIVFIETLEWKVQDV
ncbi:MAG TPA: hypothetical protein PLG52_12885, partial [Anaerolineales bacterium]|nr:hypothetical protein [Anaerolineales bacterium]